MSFVYEYSIENDFPNHAVDAGTLQDELVYDYSFESTIGVSTTDDVCSIQTADELNANQKATLDAAVAAHEGVARPFEKKHFEQEFFNTRLVRETWWARSADDGQKVSLKVEETIYTYSDNSLMTEKFSVYNRDGDVVKTRVWKFKQEKTDSTLLVRKVEQ